MLKTYSVEELEPILKVKSKAIRRYIIAGELKASSYGKNLIVREEDLIEFLDNNRVYEYVDENIEEYVE